MVEFSDIPLQRNRKEERTPRTQVTLKPGLAVVQINNVFHDLQPQPKAEARIVLVFQNGTSTARTDQLAK